MSDLRFRVGWWIAFWDVNPPRRINARVKEKVSGPGTRRMPAIAVLPHLLLTSHAPNRNPRPGPDPPA